MSYQYDLYLQKHKANVKKGFDWLQTNMPWLFEGKPDAAWQTEFEHDASKSKPDEYEAYDAYFYGGNRSYAVVQAFQRAWLLHIHRNPHHWQHWVLINDDPGEGEVLLEMPYNYIIEMICDWWAFSWAEGDLSEIFSWYDEHKDYIKLNPKTRETVEDILWELRGRLGFNVLAHHGVKGQKWGVRNIKESLTVLPVWIWAWSPLTSAPNVWSLIVKWLIFYNSASVSSQTRPLSRKRTEHWQPFR